ETAPRSRSRSGLRRTAPRRRTLRLRRRPPRGAPTADPRASPRWRAARRPSSSPRRRRAARAGSRSWSSGTVAWVGSGGSATTIYEEVLPRRLTYSSCDIERAIASQRAPLLGWTHASEGSPQQQVVGDLHRRADHEGRVEHLITHERTSNHGRDGP